MGPHISTKMLIVLVCALATVKADLDFVPWVQKQNWDPKTDDLLEMLVETYAKYNARLNFDESFQQSTPVVGILTMESFLDFEYKHFIWEGNVNMVHYAGSWAVPIRYDISDEELYPLLDSINAVLFTGGGMPLVDRETGEQSVYYKTAKKIFNYAKD